MFELSELKQRLHEEQEARKVAEQLLDERSDDLASCTKELADFALFPELSPHPVLRFSADGILLLANPKASSTFARQIKEDADLSDFFPETRDLNLKRIIKKDLTVPLKVSQGSFTFQAHIRGISSSNTLNVYLNDITNLERIKNEIEGDRIETEQLIASIRSILIELNKDGYVTRWNAEAAVAFGIETHDVIGKHIDTCVNTWSLGEFNFIEQLMEGEKLGIIEDARYTKPGDTAESHIDVSITRITSINGIPAGYLILARDVTEKKELEVQLLQAQKLESLGQLAAGIAHEINTPIQFIGDNTHFLSLAFQRLDNVLAISEKLSKRYKQQEPLDEWVEEMDRVMKKAKIAYMRSEIPYAIEEALKGLEQVASIVKGMKQFSHPGTGDKKLINVNECIQNTITVSRNEWKYIAEIETDLDSMLPSVLCHAIEINQVILNMIVNAAHAIEPLIEDTGQNKGLITIRTFSKGETVYIQISDTGTGIPEEIVSKIFDPFFTTKEPGKGTGQGLSIAYNAITKHEGTISVESTVGEGTTFTIQLPAHVQV